MTDTAEKIIGLFKKHDRVKSGMVLASTELSAAASDWEPAEFAKIEAVMRELRNEGYVIITPSKGLELTDKGYSYLIGE